MVFQIPPVSKPPKITTLTASLVSRHKAVHCDVMTYTISNNLEAVIIRHYVAPWLVEGPYEYIGAMADTDSALATIYSD